MKGTIEKAPEFSLDKINKSNIFKYLQEYDVVDEKGRYLHWDKLKWRVPSENATDIWFAIKFKRRMVQKEIPIKCNNDKNFTYCITQSMEAKLHRIIKSSGNNAGVSAGMGISEETKSRFLLSSLIMEEAISSAQLEGAATTRAVAKKMLEEEREPIDEDERMILNNYLLLKKAEASCKEELTLDLILEFHEIATRGTTENDVVPGEFRASDDIYVSGKNDEVAYQPPSFKKINERMKDLCEFANTDHTGADGKNFMYPIIKGIILHFLMGYEHPFRDGNGRTARAIFYWYMLKCNYYIFRYVSISMLLKEKPKEYGLSYLYTEDDQNDVTYFIDFQLDIILTALDELNKYIQEKAKEFEKVIELLENSKHKDLHFVQKDLIKKAAKYPGRTFIVKEVANVYSVSENTARKYLNELVKKKLFMESKDGRTILYIAPSSIKERILNKS